MSEVAPPRREDCVEVLHGITIEDPYRWMESGGDPEVVAWEDAERGRFKAFTQGLDQVRSLVPQLEKLWRVADELPPRPVARGERLFIRAKEPEQDKWVYFVQDGIDGERRSVLDPNAWASTQTVAGFWPSFDGRLAVVGRATAGDEDPELLVLDVDTGALITEPTQGWRRSAVSWHPDGTGFWFSGRPTAGSVAPGDEHYWHRVWFHRLGAPPETDVVVVANETDRERFHGAGVSDDGRWSVLGSYRFSANTLWVEPVDGGERRLATDHLDAHYEAFIHEDRLFVRTDWGAPRFRLMVGDPAAPHRDGWRELIPEGEGTLAAASVIGGLLYLTWSEDVVARVSVHDLDGKHLHDVELPGEGTASVWGRASRPEVWVSFESCAQPVSFYRYDVEERQLRLFRQAALPLDVTELDQTRLMLPSADGTLIPVFVLHRRGQVGARPLLLTGYGGFNVSRNPRFSSVHAVWAKLGGAVAVACLRGGGEYGRAWHDAGKRGRKQNVFDDFYGAAEGLIEGGWTEASQLAISGGSNGGLLVAVAVTQRPDLFAAARCAVPLTDMVRFPRFGIASVWAEEYGDPTEAEALAWLHAYSPYHRARPRPDYPAMLVTGSLNDARTDPVHARKMYAALQHAAEPGGPTMLLHIQAESGHHGAVTVADLADQTGRDHGFLMSQVGLDVTDVVG